MEEENGSNTYALEAHNRNIKRIDGFGQVSETCDANWLHVFNFSLTSIIFLRSIQYLKLRSVDLSFNRLTALEGFKSLVDLRELKVYANRLESLGGLEK